ncbi:hypothetical protein R9X47_21465 [Wukongibacter baidiensis]|uniref:hypothetical protein n=1 Tax=Wukongibacter baidiensis TaxID=1723361 RepID=UPI003D7FE759
MKRIKSFIAKPKVKILIAIVALILVKILLDNLFQTRFPIKVTNQNDVFTQESIEQIEKQIKSESEIYVSSVDINNNELLNFSVHFLEPLKNNKLVTWFVIYNEYDNVDKYKNPYMLFYSSTGDNNASEIQKYTISEDFETLRIIQPYLQEVFNLIPEDTLKGQLKFLEMRYSIWHRDAWKETAITDKDILYIEVGDSLSVSKGINLEKINDKTFYIFNAYDDENWNRCEDLVAVVNVVR